MSVRPSTYQPTPSARSDDDGVEGNARLTSTLGLILLVLLAIEGFTVLSVRQMISLHIIVGLLVVAPVLLKCATTGYRFVKYYGKAPAYRRKGPPHIVLRVLGPVVILTSLMVLGTGIALIADPHGGFLLTAHQASFFVWFGAMTIHVLGHVVEGTRHAAAELRRPALRGRRLRLLATGVALLVGVGVALAVYPSATSWTNGHDGPHHHDRVASTTRVDN